MQKAILHTLHLRNGHAVVVPDYEKSYKYYPKSTSIENLEAGRIKNKSRGTLSPGAQKKMRNAINNLIAASTPKKVFSKKSNKYFTFKCGFVTLTLSDKQKHDDQEINKLMLKPFLQWLRDSKNVVNYVWKSETQKNGNIHYHIIINKFIHYREIQKHWNKLQLKYGYLDNYYKKNKHYDAPSTEIKAIKNIKNISGYFIKYLAKNQTFTSKIKKIEIVNKLNISLEIQKINIDLMQKKKLIRRKIKGRIWNCTERLLKKCEAIIIQNKIREEVSVLYNKISDRIITGDFYEIMCYKNEKFLQFKSLIREKWIDFIASISEPYDQFELLTI